MSLGSQEASQVVGSQKVDRIPLVSRQVIIRAHRDQLDEMAELGFKEETLISQLAPHVSGAGCQELYRHCVDLASGLWFCVGSVCIKHCLLLRPQPFPPQVPVLRNWWEEFPACPSGFGRPSL